MIYCQNQEKTAPLPLHLPPEVHGKFIPP